MKIYRHILIESEKRISYIYLNRPEKRNALNEDLITDLHLAFDECESQKETRIIVLASLGDVFSAGADLSYLEKMRSYSYEENLVDSNKLKDLLLKIYRCSKIVIAQVQGHAIAGGCGLVSVCDFAFASPMAKFGYTEVQIGFVPALVACFLLKKIGESKTKELLLSGKLITASDAVNMGLITSTVENDKLAGYVKTFSEKIASQTSSHSIAITKNLLERISNPALEDALALASEVNAKNRASEDFKKGVGLFLNKETIIW